MGRPVRAGRPVLLLRPPSVPGSCLNQLEVTSYRTLNRADGPRFTHFGLDRLLLAIDLKQWHRSRLTIGFSPVLLPVTGKAGVVLFQTLPGRRAVLFCRQLS